MRRSKTAPEELHMGPWGFRLAGELILCRGPSLSLPCGCVSCGRDDVEGARGRRSQKLSYSPPWVWLFIFLNILLSIILSMALAKKVTIEHSLCDACNQQRLLKIAIAAGAWLTLLLGMYFGLSAAIDELWLLGLFAGLLIFALLLTVMARYPLRIRRYRKGLFEITGAHPRYLQSLRQSPQGDIFD